MQLLQSKVLPYVMYSKVQRYLSYQGTLHWAGTCTPATFQVAEAAANTEACVIPDSKVKVHKERTSGAPHDKLVCASPPASTKHTTTEVADSSVSKSSLLDVAGSTHLTTLQLFPLILVTPQDILHNRTRAI